MSVPTVEEAQSIILKTLAASPSGEIADSRELTFNGADLKSEKAQAVIKAALDSLLSKVVSDVVGLGGGGVSS
jgi:hypothetical protein